MRLYVHQRQVALAALWAHGWRTQVTYYPDMRPPFGDVQVWKHPGGRTYIMSFTAEEGSEARAVVEVSRLVLMREPSTLHMDGTPCACDPGTVGWVKHHGMAPSETGLSQAFYDAIGIDEEDE